jgi:MinD superfamily P-loop ATPase
MNRGERRGADARGAVAGAGARARCRTMSRALRVAVASGKGGTGKTTIATSLVAALAGSGARAAYVDCDVEEPNGQLFLRPAIHATRKVSIPVPEVDETRCNLCGACGSACRHSAIVALPKKTLTFPELCHGCGGCAAACAEGAIREVPRVTGVVEEGTAGGAIFVQGRLDVGEAMAPPVIRAVLAAAPGDGTVVIDAPPGTSCPVIESVKTADVVLLVTEPTPFGLNDLRLSVEMVRELGLPFGVAVNRAGIGDSAVLEYCADERIPCPRSGRSSSGCTRSSASWRSRGNDGGRASEPLLPSRSRSSTGSPRRLPSSGRGTSCESSWS